MTGRWTRRTSSTATTMLQASWARADTTVASGNERYGVSARSPYSDAATTAVASTQVETSVARERVMAAACDGGGRVGVGRVATGGVASPRAGQSERATGTSTSSAGTLHSQKPTPNAISSTWKTITPVQPTRAAAPPRRSSSPSTISPAARARIHGTG